MPIVPNFILKLEQSHSPKHNISEKFNCSLSSAAVTWNSTSYNATQLEDDCKARENAEEKKEEKEDEYEEYGDANVKSGIMFGSKALVQMLFNPFVGPITNR